MKIAIIGSGIAGNVAAHRLHSQHEVTVYEASDHVGGHSHTHKVTVAGKPLQVDTGFIVFNDRTYPNFVALLDELGVASQPSAMSFSVRDDAQDLEYNGTTINSLFAQRRNFLRPSFLAMVRDILRFNRNAPRLLLREGDLPLGEMLRQHGYCRSFIDHYIIPMGAAIWSASPRSMFGFPTRFFVRFLMNHGMLTVNDRPEWRTVVGGSANYVERLTAGFRDRIRLRTPVEWIRRQPGAVIVKAQGHEAERYDAIFLACHSDQALKLLEDPTRAEREVLGAIPYQRNEAILHTDSRLMPRRRLAWACWNYHSLGEDHSGPLALTYNMNMLQNLESPEPLLVTLNRSDMIHPDRIILRASYDHPVFTPASIAAQARHREIDGYRGTYYCGAWWRNGFHEDGVVSAIDALAHFEQDHAQRAVYRAG